MTDSGAPGRSAKPEHLEAEIKRMLVELEAYRARVETSRAVAENQRILEELDANEAAAEDALAGLAAAVEDGWDVAVEGANAACERLRQALDNAGLIVDADQDVASRNKRYCTRICDHSR